MIQINNRNDLRKVAKALQVREDWHEPDEQSLTAEVKGTVFDNAGFWGPGFDSPIALISGSSREMSVVIKQNGMPMAEVNLATLLALATGTID